MIGEVLTSYHKGYESPIGIGAGGGKRKSTENSWHKKPPPGQGMKHHFRRKRYG